MVLSMASASPDLYPDEGGEGKEMSRETSPSNDLLGSWDIFHHKQLREQKEMMSR